MLPDDVRAWEARGGYSKLAGIEVFHIDTGPVDAEDVAVVLHGFPTSSHDFHRALHHMGNRRILLLDLPGFGLSDKPGRYSYSLLEQADLVEILLRERGVRSAHVVAHDMGTSVACELVARRERGLLGFDVRSLVLMNGSVHIELAHLTPSQRLLRTPAADLFARVGSYRIFRLQMSRIVGRPLPDADYRAMWAQLVHRGGRLRLPKSISYLDERRRFWDRWIGALTRLDVPVRVLWGPLDTVAVSAIAERLAEEIPTARLEWLDGLGHYPQLEDPERTGRAIARFLDGAEVTSGRSS